MKAKIINELDSFQIFVAWLVTTFLWIRYYPLWREYPEAWSGIPGFGVVPFCFVFVAYSLYAMVKIAKNFQGENNG